MRPTPPYYELIEKNLINNPDWSLYTKGIGPMPDRHADVLKVFAQFLFYMGDFDHAREVSYKVSIYWEKQASRVSLQTYSAITLFDGALYRSLAQEGDEASNLWQEIVEKLRQIPETEIFEQHMAHLWVYEAYALERLKRHNEVLVSAKLGLDAINKGMATYKLPHKNSRVYGLVNILSNLAGYQANPSNEMKKKTQESLATYKNENLKHGRLGYDIIFDLQFSYPDIFEPVLPGSDPEKD